MADSSEHETMTQAELDAILTERRDKESKLAEVKERLEAGVTAEDLGLYESLYESLEFPEHGTSTQPPKTPKQRAEGSKQLLTKRKRNGINDALIGRSVMEHPSGDGDPPLVEDLVPVFDPTATALEVTKDLSGEELALVAGVLLDAAKQRREQESSERAVAQGESLDTIRTFTAAIEAARTGQLEAIGRARQAGASWTKIGEAAGVKRDVAFKRWASLFPGAEE